jgi:hypothetical protein
MIECEAYTTFNSLASSSGLGAGSVWISLAPHFREVAIGGMNYQPNGFLRKTVETVIDETIWGAPLK